jgi:hypothetical protein
MTGQKLPDSDHVLRYVPWGRLIKADDDETVTGVFAKAFELREDEAYLSLTWLEFFAGEVCDRLQAAVAAFRLSMSVGKKSRFVMANVARLSAACNTHGCKVRILHEPDPPNDGHVAVRRYPRENQDLFDLLAAEVFSAHVENRAIP